MTTQDVNNSVDTQDASQQLADSPSPSSSPETKDAKTYKLLQIKPRSPFKTPANDVSAQ